MNLQWMLIRGSGLLAYALLAASVLWGLVLSLGTLPKSVKNLTLVHESLSVAALVATLVHMVAIGLDEFVDFDAAAVLVPGRAPWKPLAVAWGIAAFYGMVVVILSFYIRKHIGQATWRSLHYLSFGVFLSALVHGLTAGTDTADPWVFLLYAGTGAAVLVLVVLRVLATGGDEAAAPPPARPERSRQQATPPPPTAADGDATKEVPQPATAVTTTSPTPPVDPAPATVEQAPVPTRSRIPEHLLERARVAREGAGLPQPAEAPADAAAPAEAVPAAVGAPAPTPPTGDAPPARKPRIPPEALAAAKAARAARDGDG